MKNNPITIYTSLVIAMVFWSLSFVWYKIAYISFGPITVILSRLIIATFFLFILAISINRFQIIKQKDIKYFILLALFEPFIYFMGESYGIMHISSTLAAVIVSTIPLFTPIMALLLYKEKFTVLNFSGIIISIIGIALIVFNNESSNINSLKGIGLMFIAVIGAVGYSVFVKKLVDKYNPFMIVGYQNLFGMLFFIPVYFLVEFKSVDFQNIDQKAILAVFKLAIFASSFAFIFFTFSIRRIGISKATAFVNSIPALTAIFAFYIIDESISFFKITGIGIVIAGLFLSQMKRRVKQELFLDDGQNISG
ncbi:DMT family transporter [Bacteroidota bacterium]